MSTVLVADDDEAICTVLERAIRKHGHDVLCTGDGATLLHWVQEGKGDLVISDVMMPVGGRPGSAFDLLPKIREARPVLPVIVISAQNTLMTAVKANQAGACEYLPKPFDLHELLRCVDGLLSPAGALSIASAAQEGQGMGEDWRLLGTSPAMQDIYRMVGRLVGVDLTVLINGESGTGKELIARALHFLSRRKQRPFVALNMAAIPRELVESELFGYEKGAFTGAQQRKGGKFEQAEGGTIFLDEIGDMPMDAQTRLLRVLQQGEYTAVGGSRTIKTDVRIICATHRDLAQLVKDGQFREDLFYRLNVVPIRVPPLRERVQDIPVLAQHFLRLAAARGMGMKTLDAAALRCLQAYEWPGNVRELENLMYRLCALRAEGMLGRDAIVAELPQLARAQDSQENRSLGESVRAHLQRYFSGHGVGLPPPGIYDRILRVVEKPLIEMTLAATEGNQVRAAQLLGINRNTLHKKIGDLGIDMQQFAGSAQEKPHE